MQHLPEASRPENGSELLDTPIPGGYVVENEHFLVEHAPLQVSSAGTVIDEARRHLLDFGEMTPTESAELGSLLHRIVPAIKAVTGVERVYYLAVMERTPHFHLWLVPKKIEGELRRAAYLAQQPPLTASYRGAEAMSDKIRAEFGYGSRIPIGRASSSPLGEYRTTFVGRYPIHTGQSGEGRVSHNTGNRISTPTTAGIRNGNRK